jgi:hypothetical protein
VRTKDRRSTQDRCLDGIVSTYRHETAADGDDIGCGVKIQNLTQGVDEKNGPLPDLWCLGAGTAPTGAAGSTDLGTYGVAAFGVAGYEDEQQVRKVRP